MPAINFDRRFTLGLRTGCKLITMRRPRVDGNRPGRVTVGQNATLWTGMRTKEAAPVVTVTVAAVLRVTFGPLGFYSVRPFAEGDWPALTVRDSSPGVRALADCLHATGNSPAQITQRTDALDRLARLDGFECWADLWAWHWANEPEQNPGDERVVRDLVIWLPPVVR